MCEVIWLDRRDARPVDAERERQAWVRPLLEAADDARLAGDHSLADAMIEQARAQARENAA